MPSYKIQHQTQGETVERVTVTLVYIVGLLVRDKPRILGQGDRLSGGYGVVVHYESEVDPPEGSAVLLASSLLNNDAIIDQVSPRGPVLGAV